MMLVPVRLDRSAIHGFGVFAVQRIAQGTHVWRFSPGFDLDLDPAVIDTQLPHIQTFLRHYGYVDSRLNRYIFCCDDARFMNHSDTPNIWPDYSVHPYGLDIAVRDIAAGEEITADYRTMDGERPGG